MVETNKKPKQLLGMNKVQFKKSQKEILEQFKVVLQARQLLKKSIDDHHQARKQEQFKKREIDNCRRMLNEVIETLNELMGKTKEM